MGLPCRFCDLTSSKVAPIHGDMKRVERRFVNRIEKSGKLPYQAPSQWQPALFLGGAWLHRR